MGFQRVRRDLAIKLEKEMATHSSILAWRIPWTEEPGGLLSIGLHSQTRLKRLSMYACMCNLHMREMVHILISFSGKSDVF